MIYYKRTNRVIFIKLTKFKSVSIQIDIVNLHVILSNRGNSSYLNAQLKLTVTVVHVPALKTISVYYLKSQLDRGISKFENGLG